MALIFSGLGLCTSTTLNIAPDGHPFGCTGFAFGLVLQPFADASRVVPGLAKAPDSCVQCQRFRFKASKLDN